jgi:putative superfamily III holin-X
MGGSPESHGLPGAARETVKDLVQLARLEAQLVTAGLAKKAGQKAMAAGAGAAGGLLLLYALLFLLAAGAAGLAIVLPWWLALLIVGGALFILGLALVGLAVAGLRRPVVPREAVEQVQEDVRWLREKTS